MPVFNFKDGFQRPNRNFTTLGFNPHARVRYGPRKGEMTYAFLPAHEPPQGNEEPDPLSVLPYRNEGDEFTPWMGRLVLYSFFGPERNYTIVSPKTFQEEGGPVEFDPMGELYDAARSTPDLCALAGLGRDGKKNKEDPEAYKDAIVQAPKYLGMVNAMALEGEEAGRTVLLCLPAIAFGSEKEAKWGLIGQLQRKLPAKFVDASAAWNEFDKRYYWRDILDPNNAAPIRVYKDRNASNASNSKSPEIFNAIPLEDSGANPAPGVLISEQQLMDRIYIPNATVPQEKTDLIDLMFTLFQDYPALLRKAFLTKVPGIDAKLKAMGVVDSPSTVRQVGGRRDAAPVAETVDAEEGDDIDVSPRPAAAPRAVAPAPPRRTATAPQPVAASPVVAAPATASPRFAPRGVAAATVTAVAPAKPAAFAPRNKPAPVAVAPVASFDPSAGENSAEVTSILDALSEEDSRNAAQRG